MDLLDLVTRILQVFENFVTFCLQSRFSSTYPAISHHVVNSDQLA